MKSIITMTLLILSTSLLHAQSALKISAGTSFKTSGGVIITLQDMNLQNDGVISQPAANGSFKFTGTQNSNISGASLPVLNTLEIAKTGNAKVLLNQNLTILSSIDFTSGLLDLNNNNIQLNSSASLVGESESSRIIGASGGEVSISIGMNKPNSVNAGNLGAILSSNSNLGTVTIKRSHKAQTGTGMTGSINRYFNFSIGGNGNQSSTLRFKYFDAELNALNESNLELFRSTNNGSNWSSQGYTTRNITENWLEKTGLSPLALLTLGVDNTPPPPPPSVTGLVFNATRTNNSTVELNWTTQTETNMNGFEVQRRYANEADFVAINFVNSQAPAGNSNSPLSYDYSDANSYNGTSYYRLKIIDLNNNFIYSEIKSVGKPKGGGNGNGGGGNNKSVVNEPTTEINQQTAKITVGPNPNNGNFWFIVSGIEKETTATLYSADGKTVQQFKVMNQQKQQVNGIKNGIYLLKVPGMEAYKIIVNGNGNGNQNNSTGNSSKILY